MDASDWDEAYAARELVWSAGPNRFLEAEASDLPPGRALDLACGEGRSAIWLASNGWTATGVDFSAVAIEKAGRLATERGVEVEWICADVRSWTAPAGAFDLVVMLYLQLPAPDRAVVLSSAATALAPGGTLLVVAHDSTNLEHGYGGPKDPAVLYTPTDVVTALEGRGLEIVRAEQVERPVQTDEGERVAIDALVRAVRPG